MQLESYILKSKTAMTYVGYGAVLDYLVFLNVTLAAFLWRWFELSHVAKCAVYFHDSNTKKIVRQSGKFDKSPGVWKYVWTKSISVDCEKLQSLQLCTGVSIQGRGRKDGF